MKDNVVYNKHDNRVMVKTDGDLIILPNRLVPWIHRYFLQWHYGTLATKAASRP